MKKAYILALFLLLPSAATAMKKTLMVYVAKNKKGALDIYLMKVIDTENTRTTSQLTKLENGTEYLVEKKYKIIDRKEDHLEAKETEYQMKMGATIKDHPLQTLMNNKDVQEAIKKAQSSEGWVVVENVMGKSS